MFSKKIFFAIAFLSFWIIGVGQANLKFDKDTVDFGIVKEGDTIKYDFWFTNTGNANLEIKQAWPSCGCTHPTYTKGIIKPGERGVLNVEFRSDGFGGQTVHKNIIVINNGPEQYANFTAIVLLKDGTMAPKLEEHDHDKDHAHAEVVKKMSKSKRKKK